MNVSLYLRLIKEQLFFAVSMTAALFIVMYLVFGVWMRIGSFVEIHYGYVALLFMAMTFGFATLFALRLGHDAPGFDTAMLWVSVFPSKTERRSRFLAMLFGIALLIFWGFVWCQLIGRAFIDLRF